MRRRRCWIPCWLALIVMAADPLGRVQGADTTVSPLVTFEALCTALRDNYPMLEYSGWREGWVSEFRTKVAAAPDHNAALGLMDELVCRLNDYHTRLTWVGKPPAASPPLRVVPALDQPGTAANGGWGKWRPPHAPPALEDVTLAITSAAENCGARSGDILLEVDGRPVQVALAESWPHAVGVSVASKLRSAADRMLRGPPGRPVRLKVRRGDQSVELEVMRTPAAGEAVLTTYESEGVPVVRIARWRNEPGGDLIRAFDAFLDKLRGQPGLVIDVRGNGGGDDALAEQVIGRFIREPVIASISFRRAVPATSYDRMIKWAEPRGPWRFEGRVAVLTDEGSMSATEHFVSGMLEAGALLCGTPTSGACGLIRTVELPGGASVNVSRTFPLHTGGAPSPLLGMVPHLWQPPGVADLRAGRDSALRAGVAWLRSGQPLPARQQAAVTFMESTAP
jgi:carboxyl-terminal processing protease